MNSSSSITRLLFAFVFVVPLALRGDTLSKPALLQVGAARIDITPELPIRLTGYSGRPGEAERIERRLDIVDQPH